MALTCTCAAPACISSMPRVGHAVCFAVREAASRLPQGLQHQSRWQLRAARSQAAQQSLLHQLLCRHGMHMGIQQTQAIGNLALRQRRQLHRQDHQLWQHPGPWPAAGRTARRMPAVCLPVREAAVPGQRARRTGNASVPWQRLQAVVARLRDMLLGVCGMVMGRLAR